MTPSQDKIADLWLRRLDMIQAIISRQANNSSNAKTLCITVVTAALGLGITVGSPWAALLALLPVAAFATIDARYLHLERCFRTLHHSTAIDDWSATPSFDLSLPPASKWVALSTVKTWSIRNFYGSLALGVGIVALFLFLDRQNGL